MNNNRLSTSSLSKGDSAQEKLIHRAQLIADITELLNRPSNYERRQDGRIWIKSEGKYM